jgi:exopolysaccharide transport family protein
MSGVQSSASDIDVDLGRLFGSLAVRWKRILFVALAITALALAFAWFATPHYRAEAKISIEPRESPYTRPDSNGQNDRPFLDEESVASQVEMIQSTRLLKQVALKLNLARLPEFDETAEMGTFSRLLIIAGLKGDPNEIPPEERVLKAFREKLNVYRVENTRVIAIEMSSEDPKLAAAIPDALADAYIADQAAAKLQSNSDATNYLGPEIESLSTRVKEAEARVATFRAESDLLIGQNNSVLATQQLSELSTELSRVRANRGAAEANAEGVRAVLESGASLDALPEVLSSTLIQRLRERQVQLKADIADLSTTLLDNHPRIRALRSQLADLDRQIRTEAENVLKGLSAEANAAKLREQQLVADLNGLKAESSRAGEEEVELRALEREANAQRELLESYLARYREASSRRDGNYLPVDARIFSDADVPTEPYFPKPMPIAGAAFVGSLLVMAVITLLQELFSGRAMRPAAGSRRKAEPSYAEPVAAETIEREAPIAAAAEPAGAGHVAVRTEPEMVAAEAEAARAEPKPAEEIELPTPASTVSAEAPIVPAPRKIEPIKQEPLPEMKVERESFSEAWARHREMMDAGKHEAREAYVAHPAEDNPAEYDEPDYEDVSHSEEVEEPIMRNPFVRRKPAPAPEPASVQAGMGEVGIESAAETLIAGGSTRAIFVSPEGDEGAAAAVMVAREVADAGLRVLLIDLTASGAASRPMLDSVSYPGITNLLASEAQFTDAIHTDHYSDCHVMPVGTADPVRAMKAADRLPVIMQSLTSAYDVVVVECGASDAEGIRRLVADGTEIMVSVIEPDDETAATAAALKARGYGRVMLVSPADRTSPDAPMPGRSAA